MPEKKPTKCLSKGKELPCGREIIQDFVMMMPGSMDKYHQLCSILSSFELWSEESRTSFLSQFLDSYDILDVNCSDLVLKLCKIRWHTVPPQMLSQFTDFLCALAINHVHHINSVFNCFVDHFLPIGNSKDPPNFEAHRPPAVVDDHFQESLYALANLSIQNVVSCNPLTTPLLLKCFVKRFPHIKQPSPKLLAFMRNVLRFADWIRDEEISAEIWSLIVEKLLHIDALCFEREEEEQRPTHSNRLKQKLDNETASEETTNPMREKLNTLVEFILNYLGDGDASKVTLIREDDRLSFLQMMQRFSPEKLQPAITEEKRNQVKNMAMEEGYEEELMAL
ncbi:hypothetical protein niasHT_018209 [Heterodera trifolii]|uniref:Uncharacterized protein n=1 Tax=Heterodera trifolii TaxID=157864 RepID=A0ABD2KYK1_9BILA